MIFREINYFKVILLLNTLLWFDGKLFDFFRKKSWSRFIVLLNTLISKNVELTKNVEKMLIFRNNRDIIPHFHTVLF